jgi:hypothetical protein
MTSRLLTLIVYVCCFFGFGQSLNTEISDKGEPPYLLGKIDRYGLEGSKLYQMVSN